MKHCNNCWFIGIWKCWHPQNFNKEMPFTEEAGLDCPLWREGKPRPQLDDTKGFCSKCGREVNLRDLVNGGKGISYCSKCR
ncbi:MAG TPA: hypothetical protein P5136_00810 [Methanofastidiosum sp.]|nr:hypothetical protein [Methanofastidiosum sp.]